MINKWLSFKEKMSYNQHMKNKLRKIKKFDYKRVFQIILTTLMIISLIATPMLTIFAITQS